jgi:hypothetical protein
MKDTIKGLAMSALVLGSFAAIYLLAAYGHGWRP